jgi:hypothetical protein
VLFLAARRKLSGNAHAIPKVKEKELVPVLCKNDSTSRRMEHAGRVRSPEPIVRDGYWSFHLFGSGILRASSGIRSAVRDRRYSKV